ncbi:choline kinase [Diutina catenulata]
MDVIPHQQRSRSRSRSRHSSRSSSRRPSANRRSLSSSSLNKLQITQTPLDTYSVPSVSAVLDNTMPLDFFKQDILSLIKPLRIRKWWKKTLSPDYLEVTRLSGALTNAVYKIAYNHPDTRIPALLLRVYGKNVESLIDRESELRVLMKLSQKNIGPKLLGIFTNGRFEHFLEGFVAISKDEIRHRFISQMLARRMKDLHYKVVLDKEDFSSVDGQVVSTCWHLIAKWMDVFEQEFLPVYRDLGRESEINDALMGLSFSEFRAIVNKVRDWVAAKYEGCQQDLKFCHNDTQYGNLLLNKQFDLASVTEDVGVVNTQYDTNLAVIDFEYSGVNYPAYDIVNFFSEWMSDYYYEDAPYWIWEKAYPSQMDQLNFIKSYIEYEFVYPTSSLKTDTPAPAATVGADDTTKSVATELLQYEVKKLYNECLYWRSSVQIFWFLWGIIQAGPPKPSRPPSPSPHSAGVNSTYNISHSGGESAVVDEEEEEEAEDEFAYLKYSQQKLCVALGDAIQFGLVPEDVVEEKCRKLIKKLDTSFL